MLILHNKFHLLLLYQQVKIGGSASRVGEGLFILSHNFLDRKQNYRTVV